MRYSAAFLLALFIPTLASAQTLSVVAGVFNIFVGLMLATSFLLFGAGFMMWVTRLGTYPTYRDQAIQILQWSVGILFVLVVLLAIVQFVQNHLGLAATVIGFVIVLGALWAIATVASASSEPEEDH